MNKKVLVVEDEESIRELYKRLFGNNGWQVYLAASAEEALGIVGEGSFPVVFIDLGLPGMSGIDLCRAIKGRLPACHAYAVSGYFGPVERSDCREAGFDGTFEKPVSLSELMRVAEKAPGDV